MSRIHVVPNKDAGSWDVKHEGQDSASATAAAATSTTASSASPAA